MVEASQPTWSQLGLNQVETKMPLVSTKGAFKLNVLLLLLLLLRFIIHFFSHKSESYNSVRFMHLSPATVDH